MESTDIVIDGEVKDASSTMPVYAGSASAASAESTQPSSAVDTSTASSAAASASSDAEEERRKRESFLYPEYPPHMDAVEGVKFDFNCGFRLIAPETGKELHCIVLDKDSDNVLFEGDLKHKAYINGSKKYYMNYRIVLCDPETRKEVWSHDINMEGKDVLLQMPTPGAVGDSIAWFSFIERFQQKHKARVHVVMPTFIQELVEKQYPDLIFETKESASKLRPYAAFYLGLYFKGDTDWQPYDCRLVGLAESIGHILGIEDLSDIPPRVAFGPRTIQEPYVCIASQASSHAKHWCNPHGWRMLVEDLKARGYRVLCIDKDREVGHGDVWHHIPYGSEDFTGARPLQERIDLIHHADFFVGLSSGLSWIAWMCQVPIVMITGMCMPFGEFQTPYKIQARHACHGCWNDTRYDFDHHDFMWCPRHKGTDRAYECTKCITVGQVSRMIDRIPGVRTKPSSDSKV